MKSFKAYFITTIIFTLLAAVLWLMWQFAVGSFWVVALMFGAYGFFCCAINVAKWLQTETPEARHARRAEPMEDLDEEDAAIWEQL